MKISYNWLRQYIDTDMPVEELGDLLTEIGLEVEGIDPFESIPGGLEGMVIGEVVECGKHPDADKLSLTKVNIGAESLSQIVCGAPNVAAGQKVVVATVGATLYLSDGEPFKIKKVKIRGVESFGMICAEDEIGLGKSHDGIMVLPDNVAVGTPAAQHFNIEKDYVYEIGLTPNRSDGTSHLGSAEDVAAALKINYGHTGKVTKPDVSAFKIDNNSLPIDVTVENTAACPRYSGVSIKNIKIGPSPEWLVNRLAAVGVRTTNNVVDVTNFVLHELGQPLHAFDISEVKDHKIIVKNLPKGTIFRSLDEVERKLHAEDLLICDGQSNPMCIGGVFGGLTSGVKDETTAIFLEAAHFEARSLRRSSTRHLLRTDAAKVFEKGSDPNITVYALKRAALLIQEVAGGEIASEIVDIYPTPIEKARITATYRNINRLIGVDIPKEEIHAILAAMNMDILEKNDKSLTVAIPTNKADVTREADLIEEILRIYGLNKVPMTGTLNITINFAEKPDARALQNMVSDLLCANGYHEMMASSIEASKYYKDILPVAETEMVYINNTSNQGMDVMRPTMLFSGLEAVVRNQNQRNTDVKLYEFGKSYRKTDEDYSESRELTIFLAGQRQPEHWMNSDKAAANFYHLKAIVVNILQRLGLSGYQETSTNDDVFALGQKYHRGPSTLVIFGRVHKGITRKMDIKSDVFHARFNWDNILKALKKHKLLFSELSKYPTVRRDLTLILDKNINFADVNKVIHSAGKPILKDTNLFDIFEDENKVGTGKKSYSVSLTFGDDNKTLKDKDVEKVMSKIMSNCEGKLGAEIRK